MPKGGMNRIAQPKKGQHIKHTSNMMKRVNAGKKYVKQSNVSKGRPKSPRAY